MARDQDGTAAAEIVRGGIVSPSTSRVKSDMPTALPTFNELLRLAGHRPPKAGSKWICASCPTGKSPTLSVGDDVYFCHRCRVGGNRITLSKELGLFQERHWTMEERRQYAKRRKRVESETLAFLTWLRRFRNEQILKFRVAFDFGIALHRRAHRILSKREIVDNDTLEGCFRTSTETEHYTQILDWLDDPGRRNEVYQCFRRAQC
jgi:hypothetical protein